MTAFLGIDASSFSPPERHDDRERCELCLERADSLAVVRDACVCRLCAACICPDCGAFGDPRTSCDACDTEEV